MSDTSSGGQTGRDEAQRQAHTMADDARDAGNEAYRTVRDEAGRQADHAQGRVASEAGNVADALRKAAEASRDGSPQERTFGQVADAMADVSEAIERKDLGELMDDASDFARRNPVAFLGGAALLGFAASRFAKASSHRSPKTDYVGDGSGSGMGGSGSSYEGSRHGAAPLPPRDPVPAAAPNPPGSTGGPTRELP
ncbi:hypothetical protein [Palleronia abyssalis]|uniref:Uncharacterized protein n=1 Tax=Palleronia abyssalis TaxID=1501240 RepID=A0A2R8BTH6_9RHOB|nr:hypothetical protein [Palleronia abyssalis]SPJ23386.1 hypothetical protein PAA8504_01196 [Palleronia abyssalis]